MSNLHKFERLDLADMFDGMCRYLDGILSIDNPGFEKKTYLRYNILENCNWTKQIHMMKKYFRRYKY